MLCLEQEQLFIAIKIGDVNKVTSLLKGVSPQTLNSMKDPELKVSPLLVAAMYAGRNNDNVILPAILHSGVTITENVKEFVRNEPPNANKLDVLRNRINM